MSSESYRHRFGRYSLDVMTIVVLVSGPYLWWKRHNIPVEQAVGQAEGETGEVSA
jgi:hypothetical protein